MRLFATALLAGLCLIIGIYPLAYVLTDDRFGLLQSKPNAVVGSSWWRLGFHAHILSGGVALSVGWSQFVHGWRTRFPWVHRAVGRLYVVLVLRLDFSVAYPIVAWLCWVPNLLVARLINSRTAAASR
ncbi:hypothetical protein LBMAG46_34370 [Planctomycetia bacterium]|nr:hypothetical protein LBMAG46_34370 [Planctomycetia bacterium]